MLSQELKKLLEDAPDDLVVVFEEHGKDGSVAPASFAIDEAEVRFDSFLMLISKD